MSSIQGKIKLVLAYGGNNGNNNNNPPPLNISGSTIDIVGFGSAIIGIVGGLSQVHGDETYLLKMQHSDDAQNWLDLPDASLTLVQPPVMDFFQQITLNGLGINTKRYIRIFLAMGGTNPHFDGGIVAVLGESSFEPVKPTAL